MRCVSAPAGTTHAVLSKNSGSRSRRSACGQRVGAGEGCRLGAAACAACVSGTQLLPGQQPRGPAGALSGLAGSAAQCPEMWLGLQQPAIQLGAAHDELLQQ